MPGVRKSELRDLGGIVRCNLREVLTLDGFSERDIDLVIRVEPDTFTKASSKRVLGCMVEQARMMEFILADSGGLARVAATSVSGELNRTVLMPLKSVYPWKAMRAAIDTARDAGTAAPGGPTVRLE